MSSNIHPTAIISEEANIAADVVMGPYCIVQGPVTVGAGCVLHSKVELIGKVTLGENNEIYSNTCIGGKPQHLGYKNEATGVEIGKNNVFRENVTIHRGTTHSWMTRIGDHNFFMAGSHIAHDCKVGSKCIFANNTLLAGHCEIFDNVYISGNSAVHQFCRLGRLAFLSGISGSTKDMPPFIIQQNMNQVMGVNIVGMRRAGMSSTQINAIRRLFHIVYMQHLALPTAMALVEAEMGEVDVVKEWLDFVRTSQKGINGYEGPVHKVQLAA